MPKKPLGTFFASARLVSATVARRTARPSRTAAAPAAPRGAAEPPGQRPETDPGAAPAVGFHRERLAGHLLRTGGHTGGEPGAAGSRRAPMPPRQHANHGPRTDRAD